MLHTLTDNELRNLCREKLESLEHWLRRLIDEKLSAEYGNYFSYVDSAGNRLLKKSIIEALEERVKKEPDRYSRKIDAVLLSDAIEIICKPKLYALFQPAFENAFPNGVSEAKTFLTRLLDPRNKLAHANPISLRQAEQVICYSNDVIDSLKAYYAALGMQQEYNVPLILKVTDSFGNTFYRSEAQDRFDINLADKPLSFLRPGDVLTAEVEVDPSFNAVEYTTRWELYLTGTTISSNHKMILGITAQHVAQRLILQCRVTSNKDWHRLGPIGDDILHLSYRVLPPL